MMELQNDQIPTKTTRMQAMSLKAILSPYWLHIQGELLPWLDDAMDGPLTARPRHFVSVLGLAAAGWPGWVSGRPSEAGTVLGGSRPPSARPWPAASSPRRTSTCQPPA